MIGPLFSLDGRTAVITGGASGIGAATAAALARQGARVMIGYHPGHPHDVSAVVADIRRLGGEVEASAVEVSEAASVETLVDACVDRFAAPDIAVANAGIVVRQKTDALTSEQFATVLQVDLIGVHNLFRASVPAMAEGGRGRLLATSSTSGHLYGWAAHGAYCAAKAAVVGLVRTFAVEFAARGVTSNAVAPGIVRTPQSLDAINSLGQAGLDAVSARIPVGHVGEPADVAAVFAFLAADEASYINGQTIVVDGGLASVVPA